MTKPLQAREIMARMQVHLQGARQARQAGQARNALDAFGYASVAVRWPSGRVLWQTPLAREPVLRYAGTQAPQTPAVVMEWLGTHLSASAQRGVEALPLVLVRASHRLSRRVHSQTRPVTPRRRAKREA